MAAAKAAAAAQVAIPFLNWPLIHIRIHGFSRTPTWAHLTAGEATEQMAAAKAAAAAQVSTRFPN